MTRLAIVGLIALGAGAAWAQPRPDGSAVFEPPRAHNAEVPYPAGAPPHDQPVAVTVTLTVDATGAVTRVELVGAPQPGFDEAVIAAARGLRFDPATYGGEPVAAEVTFKQTFLPRAPAPGLPAEDGPLRSARLRGKLVELGTRAPVAGATITATAGARSYVVDGDAHGQFVLPLPEGGARVIVTAPGHRAFLQQEQLGSGQELAVTYLVERDRYDPYEILVVGDQRREEVSRIALRGAEIKQVPGTFGDPFRVVQALPGVSAVASLLAFPIVRGSAPSATGVSIDGTRVPLLYHLGAGPSVIHPEFIDEVDFYPGGAPAGFGGYTGGIVDGRTRRAGRDEHVVDVDVNLLQAGALVREPIRPLGATLTLAGRYGYPALVLGQVTNELSLSYWDYQLRLDGGTPNNGWTVFAFGARDEYDELHYFTRDGSPDPGDFTTDPRRQALRPSLIMSFHRLDLRGHVTLGDLRASARVVLGRDRSLIDDSDDRPSRFAAWIAEPSARLDWRPATAFTATLGIEGDVHDGSARFPASGETPADLVDGPQVHGIGRSYRASGFAEVLWRPGDDWLVRPGIRTDRYSDPTASHASVDPRFTVRYRLARRELDDVPADSDDSSIWLKASAGVYHQPPRYLVPLPGLDQLALSYGLSRSVQTSLGVELPLPARFEVTAETYYNDLERTFFELARPVDPVVTPAPPVLLPPPRLFDPSAPYLDQFAVRASGRSYGGELMARRRSMTGIYGWASYTLSLSERLRDGRWRPYDFDRTHLVNLVAGLPMGRNWDVGVRLQYQSGKPAPALGEAVVRDDGYTRIDVRFDKHAAWRDWILDFYVDITNVAVMPEEIEAKRTIRYALPTAGVRGRF